MDTNEENNTPPVNSHSVLSLALGIFTILFFCIGWLPIPFTGFVCFPLGVLFGLLALIFGIISLNRIRKHNHSGRPMAWIGIIIGGFVFVCMIGIALVVIAMLIFAPNSIHVPPFVQNFQI